MLSAWIREPQKNGAPQKSCHNNFVDALNDVFQSTMPNRVCGKGVKWTHIAKDENLWNFLVTKFFDKPTFVKLNSTPKKVTCWSTKLQLAWICFLLRTHASLTCIKQNKNRTLDLII